MNPCEKEQEQPASSCGHCARKINRRRAILNAGAAGIGLSFTPVLLFGQADPASEPPQPGDVLVKMSQPDKPLQPADIAIGAPPTLAWPMNPATRVARSQNRFNQLLLIKLEAATMDADTTSRAAEGVLAFSALCTHAGCTIDEWVPERSVLACDCHSSEYDPRSGGKVVDGPASRPLPALAIKLVDGNLVVAKPFAAPIRFDE